jgi:predicted DCC family thiol-disulfide oxidoreductase YuxK
VFDGTCVLCNGWVDFLLRHDRAGALPLRGDARDERPRAAVGAWAGPDDPTSFLLIDEPARIATPMRFAA